MPETIPADVPVKVLVARNRAFLPDDDGPLVAIFPDQNTWNDYGRNFFAKLHVRPSAGDPVNLHMRLMFEGRSKSFSVFSELFETHGTVFNIADVDVPFASLLTDIDDYRKVIEALGFEAGVSALRKLHDAAVARIEQNDSVVLGLIDSEEFHIGALRNGGAYDAIRRGNRYFRPDMPPENKDAAIDFVFGARLPSAQNLYTLKFRFDREEPFRDRASVLIGRNGVGKTQLLAAMVSGLRADWEGFGPKPRFCPPIRPTRVLVFSSVPTDPFPRSIGAWHGIDYEYFAVNASDDSDDSLLVALVTCKKSDERSGFGENRDQSRMDVIREAIKPIGLWRHLHLPLRKRRAGDELPDVQEIDGESFFLLGQNLNELNLIRLIQQIDWSRAPVVLDDEMRPRKLSSGEYAMLRFAAQAAAAIEPGSLLLLDEPETHLHPNFISDMMEILDSLLQSTNSIAIIATHSAYVVRETPRRRVNILSIKDDVIRIDTPRMQTFGATIDSISQFVFQDTAISHRFQKTLARWADDVGPELGIEGVIERYGEHLNTESLSFIARHLQEDKDDDAEESNDTAL